MASTRYQPVVIIGAARSGTNMLRDVLTSCEGIVTWPCDEIPFVWRYGNVLRSDDEFSRTQASPRARRYIRRAFDHIARTRHTTHVVEKTCANSLRVAFVDEVLPNARFLHLLRDGRDVVPSAMKRWVAPLDLPYLARKARFVPPAHLPYYGARFAANRIQKVLSCSGQLATWGPRFVGMAELAARESLPVVCATQWVRSIERSVEDFAPIAPDRVHEVRYEEFVRDPATHLTAIGRFIGCRFSEHEVQLATKGVRSSSVGRGWRGMAGADRAATLPIISPALERLGYPTER